MAETALKVDGIHKWFGGHHAIKGVSFEVHPGQVLGLIGPNGAGKTTIFNLINGIYSIDRGEVALGGRSVTRARPAAIARMGVGRTFQVPRTFNDMTLAENLMVPLSKLRHSLADAKVSSMLERIGLRDSASKRAGELSGGQRKLLEVVRAMMSEPRLLILDEPFSGTSSDVVDLMIGMIKEWAQQGTGCLVISHDIVSMPRLCDDVVVLVGGAVLTSGKFADVRQDERVVEAYIGQ